MVDIVALATAVTTVVSPFMPFLIQGVAKFTDVVAEKGGEAAWEKAQEVWKKIREHFANDATIAGAAAVVADDPEDEDSLKQFAKQISKRLANNPDLAQELQIMLGGNSGIQELIGGNQSLVENVRQSMKSSGIQRIQGGDNSVFRGISQDQGQSI